MSHPLSTCGVCGSTVRWFSPPDGGPYWGHVNPARDGHRIDPDDGYVSGPDAGDYDPEPCPACHHVHDTADDEDECGELVGSGLYGSDGVEVPRVCLCTGPQEPVDPSAVSPDPWLDPDAAAALNPPPF